MQTIAILLTTLALAIPVQAAQAQLSMPPVLETQAKIEGQFCFALYRDNLVQGISPGELKRRLASVYKGVEAQDALANECRIFSEGVREAASMLRGTPYVEPKASNHDDPGERKAIQSALRCHQMLKYEQLYQKRTADEDFIRSLGLSTGDRYDLIYDCNIYALGFKAGDGLIAMGMLK